MTIKILSFAWSACFMAKVYISQVIRNGFAGLQEGPLDPDSGLGRSQSLGL